MKRWKMTTTKSKACLRKNFESPRNYYDSYNNYVVTAFYAY